MSHYRIITNRKRAVIALTHSAAFLLIALRALLVAATVAPIWISFPALGPMAMLSVYLIVSSILILLVKLSRGPAEKLYFAFCATSATLGLMRTVLGDANVPAGQWLRVLMLGCALITGTYILRGFSRSAKAATAA